MTTIDAAAVLTQIDTVLSEAHDAGGRYLRQGLQPNRTTEQGTAIAITLIAAAIDRLAPAESSYRADVERIRKPYASPDGMQYDPLVGVLKALRADYAAGRLQGLRELIHADLFADLLDGAQHLLDEGHPDPAAIVAGAALEAHIRKLCDKNGVSVSGADGKPRKASILSADLAKTAPPAISGMDAKNITAWLAIRNDVAHGVFGKYTAPQIALFIQSIRDFITRLPA